MARKGLGLYLIGRVCEYYGWQFEIEGSPERGATVTLDFSAGELAAPQQTGAAPGPRVSPTS